MKYISHITSNNDFSLRIYDPSYHSSTVTSLYCPPGGSAAAVPAVPECPHDGFPRAAPGQSTPGVTVSRVCKNIREGSFRLCQGASGNMNSVVNSKSSQHAQQHSGCCVLYHQQQLPHQLQVAAPTCMWVQQVATGCSNDTAACTEAAVSVCLQCGVYSKQTMSSLHPQQHATSAQHKGQHRS